MVSCKERESLDSRLSPSIGYKLDFSQNKDGVDTKAGFNWVQVAGAVVRTLSIDTIIWGYV